MLLTSCCFGEGLKQDSSQATPRWPAVFLNGLCCHKQVAPGHCPGTVWWKCGQKFHQNWWEVSVFPCWWWQSAYRGNLGRITCLQDDYICVCIRIYLCSLAEGPGALCMQIGRMHLNRKCQGKWNESGVAEAVERSGDSILEILTFSFSKHWLNTF